MNNLSQQTYSKPAIVSRLPKFSNHKTSIAVFILFLTLTVIAAWPIISDLNNVIIGDDNDIFLNPWADWWTSKALSDPNLSLWYTNYLFYPIGGNLTFHSFSHLNSLVSLSLRPVIGALPAYNLTILLNIVLFGFSIFQLAKYLTKSTIASILAGIIFAFNSQIIYQTSHPVTFSVWCFPWMTLYLIRATRENSFRLAIIAAFFVFLGGATSIHLIILMGFWSLLLIGYMVISAELPRPSKKILLTFSLTSLLLLVPLLYPLIQDAIINQNSSFTIDNQFFIATDIAQIFTPPWRIWYIRSFYLGIAPIILFLFAIVNIRRQGKVWFLLALFSFLIVIGPTPSYNGKELGITLPWVTAIMPIIRHPYRLLLLFSFGWAMIAAYGWLAFEKTINLPRRFMLLIGVIIGAFIFIDYTSAPFPNRPATVSAFYTDYLDDIPNDVALAIIPFGRQEDKRYLYYQTYHEHPITGGIISRSEANIFDFINSNSLLRAASVDIHPVPIPDNIEEGFGHLASVNVGYFVIDKNLMVSAGEDYQAWMTAIPYVPIYEDDLVVAYKTVPD